MLKRVETEADLFRHFQSMGPGKAVSEIMIPELGTFRVFYEAEAGNEENKVEEQEKFPLWANVLEQIREKVSTPSFQTWFVPTSAMKLEGSNIAVICPNEFQLQWLQTHYMDTIIEAVKQVTGEEYGVKFIK